MDRPKMDRPREVKGTPFTREAKRLLKAGLLITAIVLAVGSLPVVLLWFWADDLDEPGTMGIAVDQQEVRFASGDVELAGRLWLPTGRGPFAALVVAHGSGEATRDRYQQLGEDLALNGFALLAYDKRGVGESGGAYADIGAENSAAVFDRLAEDVVAGVGYLRSRSEIDGRRIGVYGVSQGGWIAPLAASKSDDVRFLTIVSGPAVSVGEEIFYSGLTGERESARPRDGEASELSQRLADYDGPHGFDPVPVLERIDIPALWVLGDGDRSIPIPETVAELEQLAAAGKPFEFELLPGVGHGMRDLRTGEQAPSFAIVFSWLVQNIGM